MTSERKLRVGSTFSGVGGADLGLERAGFELAWTCEWDEWKRSILAAHWPDIPHYGDIRDLADAVGGGGVSDPLLHPRQQDGRSPDQDTDIDGSVAKRGFGDIDPINLLVGGFPCQDLSVAGKRRGFDGERSVLAFEFLRVAESLRPRWLLMENVPGLLSSNGGRDLARLLDELGTIGYGWAYRILDARYFGVPQRRRRVFICARRADPELDTRAAAGLALRALWEGSSGDPTPGWPPREILAASVGGSAASGRIVGTHGAADESVTGTLTRMYSEQSGQDYMGGAGVISFYPTGGSQNGFWDTTGVSPTIKVGSSVGAANGIAVADVASTLQRAGGDRGQRIDAEGAAGGHLIPQAFTQNQRDEVRDLGNQAGALVAQPGMKQQTFLCEQMSVRRLTPVECERLMGWPDNWTAPPGVKAPDSKRYAACGDGIVSWVAYWIGMRIQMIESEDE